MDIFQSIQCVSISVRSKYIFFILVHPLNVSTVHFYIIPIDIKYHPPTATLHPISCHIPFHSVRSHQSLRTLSNPKNKKINRMYTVLAPNHHPKRQLQKIQKHKKHKKRNSGHYGNRQKDHSLNIITHSFNHWQNTVIFGYSSFDIPRRHRVWYPIHPIYGDTECTTRTEMKYKKRMHSEVRWKRNGNDRDSPIFIDIDSDSHNKSQQMQTLKI